MIDPRALRTFHEVCRAGTITGAAKALALSQPSVSQAIALLEARLGVVLFERTRGGIVLTPAGEALRGRATMLDHLLRDAGSEVAAAAAGVAGPLRIGGTPGALVSLLPQGLARLDAVTPRLTLHVLERPDHELAEMLRAGDIELALVTVALDEPAPDMAERALRRDRFALIAAPDHPLCRHGKALADGEALSLRGLSTLRWVLPEAQGAFRRQVDALFVAAGLSVPRDVIRCDSLLTTKAVVRDTGRVTILPHEVVASELAMGVLVALPLAEATFARTVGARWLKARPLSPLAGQLLDLLAVEA